MQAAYQVRLKECEQHVAAAIKPRAHLQEEQEQACKAERYRNRGPYGLDRGKQAEPAGFAKSSCRLLSAALTTQGTGGIVADAGNLPIDGKQNGGGEMSLKTGRRWAKSRLGPIPSGATGRFAGTKCGAR